MVDQLAETPHEGDSKQPPQPTAWAGWRPVLLRLHFYGGVFIGPFILIAAVTGLLYTFTPQLDAIVFRHEVTVDGYTPQTRQITVAGASVNNQNFNSDTA